jgi:hypothetical protein
MTTAEVANKLKVGKRQVQRLCMNKTLAARWELGRYVRRGIFHNRWGWNISAVSVAKLLKTEKYPSR